MTMTEQSAEFWAQGTKALTDPFGALTNASRLDLTHGVELFFEVAQRTMDANREFFGIWAGLVGSLTAVVREPAETDTGDPTEKVAAAADHDDGRSERAGTVIDDLASVDGR